VEEWRRRGGGGGVGLGGEDEVGAAFGIAGALKWRLRRHRAQASIWSYCWKDIKILSENQLGKYFKIVKNKLSKCVEIVKN
jgi:hypothetical protein